MSPPATSLPEQQRLALGGRQQTGEHLHRGRLAAAVRAEESEDLAALDAEAHVVDGDEVAEALGEPFRLDDRLRQAGKARRDDQFLVAALLLRQERNEGFFEGLRLGPRLDLRRGARAEDPPGVHGDQPVEGIRLLHVRGGDDGAHATTLRADARDELPELPPRERVDAGRRLVQDQ
jgi:hypothetical protein